MAGECTFCRVARGEIEAYRVFEGPVSVGFLDRRPLFPGHCLMVPREHVETLSRLPESLLTPFFASVQLLNRAVEAATDAEGSFVAVNNRVSQSVPHLHVHIVPRRRKDGLRGFFWPRQTYPDGAAAAAVRDAIRAAVERLR